MYKLINPYIKNEVKMFYVKHSKKWILKRILFYCQSYYGISRRTFFRYINS